MQIPHYLEIHCLEKSFDQNKILHGLSFSVKKGEWISLLGPSGCGKTTLLRCIAGLEHADPGPGEIRLEGEILSSDSKFVPPEKRRFGMVFQNYAVWPHLNVFENVAFPIRLKNSALEAQIRAEAFEALNKVRLQGLEKRYPHELSGGQQQRVALARALAMKPRLLLLDEPLSNLDAGLRDELGSEIRTLQSELGLTTLLVTHDRKEALSLSDRILVLNNGRLEGEGSPEKLYHNPPNAFIASFLSQAQTLRLSSGETCPFFPRAWKIVSPPQPKNNSYVVKILSRNFLGNEYQYTAICPEISEPIRFFSTEQLDLDSKLCLKHEPQ